MDTKNPTDKAFHPRNPIRGISLEHWFTNYQLKAIKKSHVHVPITIEIEVTKLMQCLAKAHDGKPPLTAALLKALGLWLEAEPEANRLFMQTLLGPRIVEPPTIGINMPFMIEHRGSRFLSAMIIHDPQTMTIAEIQETVRNNRKRGFADKPITHFLATRRNNWLNRMILRGVHMLAYRFPAMYLKHGGGGVSLSSLNNVDPKGAHFSINALGPTAFTFCVCGVESRDGKAIIRLGVTYDHLACHGETATRLLVRLTSILSGEDQPLFLRLVDGLYPIPWTSAQTDFQTGADIFADYER